MTEETKSPEEIEQDIKSTRADIDQTIEALQSKLSPGELLDQALGFAKDGGGEFAANLGRTVRDNPLPLLLTGAGLAWLMMAGRPQENDRYSARDYREAASYPPRHEAYAGGSANPTGSNGPVPVSSLEAAARSPGVSASAGSAQADASKAGKGKAGELKDAAAEQAKATGEKLSGMAESVREQAAEVGAGAREKASAVRERAGDYLDQAREHGGRARAAAGQFVNENPLVVGALGLALGAVIAAALPATRREDEMLGEKSDELKQVARQAGREQAEKAKDVADAALDGGKAEAERQDLMPETVKREAGRVAQAGAEVVKAAGKAGEAKLVGGSGNGEKTAHTKLR